MTLLTLLAYALTVRNSYLQALTIDHAAVADWLISYPGEFVRRGLGGELLWRAEQLSGLSMVWWIFTITVVFQGLLTATTLYLIWRLNTLIEWVILISPATIFFTSFELGVAGRKEMLLLVIPALLLWRVRPHQFEVNVALVITGLLTVLLFLHEGMIFFMPLLGLFLWLYWGRGKDALYGLVVMGAWLVLVFLTIALLNIAHPPDTAAQCALLAQRGALPPRCDEPLMTSIAWLNVWPAQIWQLLEGKFDQQRWLSLMAAFLLCGLPLMLLNEIRHVKYPYALAVIGILPLFAIAVDWGRWVYIISMMTLYIQALIRMQAGLKPSPVVTNAGGFIVVAFGLSIWVSSWQLLQCCAMGAEWGAMAKIYALIGT